MLHNFANFEISVDIEHYSGIGQNVMKLNQHDEALLIRRDVAKLWSLKRCKRVQIL